MTALDWQTTFHPQLRSEVVVGPMQRSGDRNVTYVKDTATNWFYRMGPKETFLIRRMDGTRTLEEIGLEYAAQFGRRLDAGAWQNLLTMLQQRQLLASSSDPGELEKLRARSAANSRSTNRGLLQRRIPLLDPDRFLARLLPYAQFAFRAPFVVACSALILAMESFVALNLSAILATLEDGPARATLLPLSLALTWLAIALHETAHGLACKRYGGSVPEMGIVWRFFVIGPYCKADDVVLFQRRRHRVVTAFAGVFMSLVLVLPFAVLWWLAPDGSGWKTLAGSFLVFGNIAALVNFVPFLELDGYHMLSHGLGMLDLRQGAFVFWKRRLRASVRRRSGELATYSRRDRWIYTIYGAATFLFAAVVVCIWVATLERFMGEAVVWVVAGFLAVAALAYRPMRRARNRGSGDEQTTDPVNRS